MTFSKTKKKEPCQHDDFCPLSETVCEETDFSDTCRMKDSDINEMPLLKTVKKSVEKRKEKNKES